MAVHENIIGQSDHVSSRTAFSLVEISIVLAVVSVVMAGILPILNEASKQKAQEVTIERMNAIERALVAFAQRSDRRLPCPADNRISLMDTSGNFGREAEPTPPGSNNCTGGTIETTFQTSDVAVGGVPVKTLGLSDEFAFDGWNRRFTYIVSRDNLANNGVDDTPEDGVIIVQDSNGNERTDSSDTANLAAYALISHGANGHGGYMLNTDTRYQASGYSLTNAAELQNCTCDDSANNDTGTAVAPHGNTAHEIVVQGMANNAPDEANAFDDIVRYNTPIMLSTMQACQ